MVSLPKTWVEFVEHIHLQYISVKTPYNLWSPLLVTLALVYPSVIRKYSNTSLVCQI